MNKVHKKPKGSHTDEDWELLDKKAEKNYEEQPPGKPGRKDTLKELADLENPDDEKKAQPKTELDPDSWKRGDDPDFEEVDEFTLEVTD
ncbi:hypothetical protein BJ508DRAFT_322491 [Ascobolus immersus RN42]|uniref:Uncharacterized protein n=1 Tax=Ascobolus immersus RN42 TaxID=1160509 RepID=A0A3N4IJ29_ASCIM|nr:hypothetical protein BJ508DRAFT_322491 [Ascobolus immersus RN42]